MDAVDVVVNISSPQSDRYLKFTSIHKVSLVSPNGGYILLLLYSSSEVPHSRESVFIFFFLIFLRKEKNVIRIFKLFDYILCDYSRKEMFFRSWQWRKLVLLIIWKLRIKFGLTERNRANVLEKFYDLRVLNFAQFKMDGKIYSFRDATRNKE